jgi:hypothetical protein
MSCHQESELQRLLLVQSRITVRGVVEAQILVYKTFTATSALGDCISCELKVHATKERTMLLVDLERG